MFCSEGFCGIRFLGFRLSFRCMSDKVVVNLFLVVIGWVFLWLGIVSVEDILVVIYCFRSF